MLHRAQMTVKYSLVAAIDTRIAHFLLWWGEVTENQTLGLRQSALIKAFRTLSMDDDSALLGSDAKKKSSKCSKLDVCRPVSHLP
jgi:hypothetical protein